MKTSILSICTLLFLSCSNFLNDYSQDLVVAENANDLDEIMLGSCYLTNATTESFESNPLWWLHVLDDDITTIMTEKCVDKRVMEMNKYYYGYTTWQKEVGRNYTGNGLSADNQVWDQHYQRINSVNIVLAQLNEIDIISEKDHQTAIRIQGECHFLRAYYYWMLTNLYANPYSPDKAQNTLGIPLKTTDYVEHDKDKNTQFTRAKLSQVYELIVNDLQQSIRFFRLSPQIHSFYRGSEQAALLLLSRVYLYMQEWKLAKEAALELINKNIKLLNYNIHYNNQMVNPDARIMTEKNPEILFSQGSLSIHHIVIGESGVFGVAKDLVNQYVQSDIRYHLYFQVNEDNNKTYRCKLNQKYNNEIHRSQVSDIYVLRSAECYLNLAEAAAMDNDEALANQYLTILKQNRYYDFQPQTYTGQLLIDEIRLERRREFCFEGGHRWFDLRRYSVCIKSPYQKVIERLFAYYDNEHMRFVQGEIYHLEQNDPAYTFSIPKQVLEFDRELEDNIRPKRELIDLITLDEE